MLTAIILLSRILAPTPALTPEQMDDLQAHAEAANRLARGEIEQASLQLAPPAWAFSREFDPQDPAEPFADMTVVTEPFEQ